jgi:hypothetical protein
MIYRALTGTPGIAMRTRPSLVGLTQRTAPF